MADIANEIAAINTAVYGEEVRGAIVNALNSMNASLENAIANQLIELDSTLSQTGKGADSQTVGYAIQAIGASPYSSSSEYEPGDLVLHGNALYRCTGAIVSPMEWNDMFWEATTLAAEIMRLRSDIENSLTAF